MERRYVLFIAISLAAILAGQALQAWLYPRPPADQIAARPDADDAGKPDAGGPQSPAGAQPEKDTARPQKKDSESAAADDKPGRPGADAEVAAVESAPRTRRTLGSLDPAGPAHMLVTLTSRGAAVERIELADERFHDQDDRSGYLGHLAPEQTAEGCRLGVVGPGTPADEAGLRAGDVVLRVDGEATPDPRTLHAVLAARQPRQRVEIEFSRDGTPQKATATLDRRPLEVVRPETKSEPVIDPDGERHDPLSFRFSFDSLDGRSRREPLAEIPGQQLADVDWETAATADGAGVAFSRRLPNGITVVKEYRLGTAGEGQAGYRLELVVRLSAGAAPAVVSYALDGPTGLPTEGWWYAQRVGHSMWTSLAVRDVAMRFVGEQSTLVSGLKIADGKLDHPASSVRDGKPLSFAGVDALYFAAALIPAATGPEAPALAEVRPLVVGNELPPARKKLVDVTSRLVSKEIELASGSPVVHRYEIFAGPKQPELLRGFGVPGAGMDDLVYYGWFGWVARPMIAILHAIHAVIGNYGIAILLLTVMVRGAMFPVSRKQALSSQKMQLLQPEMKAIAEKYKNEPEKKTRATQELWRKHDYNPMGGCLLVFIQIPIFMGLYRSLATDVELRQAPLFSSAIRWCSNLAAPDMLWNWSQALPAFLTSPEGWLGPYLNLFPLATIGLFLWQQKLFMPPAMDEQQKMQQQVMNYMMWFMALMFFKVPCGLCLYFIASSLWGIAERLWLPATLPAAPGGGGRTVVDAAFSPVGKAGANGAADAVREKRQARKKQR